MIFLPLQVLKELLTHASNPSHRHHEQFKSTILALDGPDGRLAKNLMLQLKSVLNEPVPSKETHGDAFGDQCQRAWAHSNLREQSELLQITLVYLHSGVAAKDVSPNTLKEYFDLFQVNQ